MASTAPAPRRRHLMDPANPVRPVNDRELTNVQRYVMSTVVVITAAHMAAGFIVAAMAVPVDATAARIGLNVIAGAFMVLGIGGALAIHRHRVISPWLLLGVATTLVGLWLLP